MVPACSKGGGQAFAMPDVCKTPSPGGPVPIPYPNIGMLVQTSKESTKVKIVGKGAVTKKSEVPRSQGDEAGTLGGVVSNVNMNKITFKQGSGKVKVEGQPLQHLAAPTAHNGANANSPAGVVLAPSQVKVLVTPGGAGGGGGSSLPGVTKADLALAASASTSPEAQAARKKVVKAFLKKHGREWDDKKKAYRPPNKKEIASQLKGHDLAKPVKVGPPPRCPSPQTQWQKPNGFQGQYYTDAGVKPGQVGIASYSRDGAGRFVEKVPKAYKVSAKAPYLESTAAPVKDTWSVSGVAVPAQGGGVQRVIGERALAKALGV